MATTITSAEEAIITRELLIPLRADYKQIHAKATEVFRQINRWSHECIDSDDFEIDERVEAEGGGYEERDIWTDIGEGGYLEPIPLDAQPAELEQKLREYLSIVKDLATVRKQVTDYSRELKLWETNQKEQVLLNLKEWYNACNEYGMHLNDSAYKAAGQKTWMKVEKEIFEYLLNDYVNQLMQAEYNKIYKSTSAQIVDGVLTVEATRSKGKKVTFILDDFYNKLAQYTGARVKAQHREMRADSILND